MSWCRLRAIAQTFHTVCPISMPLQSWLLFALASAFFAALTAIFAKLGVAGVNSDLATLVSYGGHPHHYGAMVTARGEWRRPEELPVRQVAFLVLSGIATGFGDVPLVVELIA